MESNSLNKLYYTIGEVADIFHVNTSLIRFWEKEFNGFLKPIRNKKGNRLYTEKDLEKFKLIYYLIKEKKLTIKGAKQKLREKKDEVDAHFIIISHLQHIKQEILLIKEELNHSNRNEN